MTTSNEPLVSVVTPVHNGERFLRACIESVLSQSYTNWDYTIVNNKSADRTLEIAREYAAKDPRIRVHDNERFLRVIENHNHAFRQISPGCRYCKVVAADDLLFEECLEKMVRVAEEHPSVAIVGAYGLQGMRVCWGGLPYPGEVVKGREVCRLRLLHGTYVFGTPTSVLYRADVVRNTHAFFNESNLHSDSEACMRVLEHHDFGFVHQILTVQGVRPDSLTSFSQRFRTYLPGFLHELVVYGPKYLEAEEMQVRLAEHLREYYGCLAGQALRRRGGEFWQYHRGKLRDEGFPFSRRRLAVAMAARILDHALNPKRALRGIARRARGGAHGAAASEPTAPAAEPTAAASEPTAPASEPSAAASGPSVAPAAPAGPPPPPAGQAGASSRAATAGNRPMGAA